MSNYDSFLAYSNAYKNLKKVSSKNFTINKPVYNVTPFNITELTVEPFDLKSGRPVVSKENTGANVSKENPVLSYELLLKTPYFRQRHFGTDYYTGKDGNSYPILVTQHLFLDVHDDINDRTFIYDKKSGKILPMLENMFGLISGETSEWIDPVDLILNYSVPRTGSKKDITDSFKKIYKGFKGLDPDKNTINEFLNTYTEGGKDIYFRNSSIKNTKSFQNGGNMNNEEQLQKEFIAFLIEDAAQQGLQIQSEEDLNRYVQAIGKEALLKKYQQFMQMKQGVSMNKLGDKLNYIRKLKGNCPEGSEKVYLKNGGCMCRKKEVGGKLPEEKKMNIIQKFKSSRKKH